MLILLAALWGASFLFMRIAAPSLGPIVLIELRVSIAGLALLLFAAIRKHRTNVLQKWKQYLLLGAFNAAIPFSLIATAELHSSASLAAILNATSPLFTALVAWVWMRDPFTVKKFVGLVSGVIGVAVLVGWNPHQNTEHIWLSVLMSLLAALFYGIAGVYSARAFKGEKPMDMAIGQQLAAGLLLVPFAASTLPNRLPSLEVILSVLGLAILCTSFGYLLYFALIRNVGPVKAISVTFLVPIFGILWGAIFLGESISFGTFVGFIMILLSVTMVANIPLRGRKETDVQVPAARI